MTKRRPLDLLQKWKVAQYWVKQKPPITRSALVVLVRLLERQNPKSGRCDPSAIGLLEETGLSERSVRGAFKEFEERGAVKRYRIERRSRNQFLIFSVEELAQHQRSTCQKVKVAKPAYLQRTAARSATSCQNNLQATAPEKIKETIKKNEIAETAKVRGARFSNMRQRRLDMNLAEFEQRAVKVFERCGYGYEGLLALPAGEVETVFSGMRDGIYSFNQAVSTPLEKYRSQEGGQVRTGI